MSPRFDDLSNGRAGPDHWAQLLTIDPELLDVGSLREEVLRRLTGPVAAIVLVFYFSLGASLRLAGLDVARITGHNAFGFFGLEAAFNGIALLILSAPLGFFALATSKARGYQRRLVDWILQGPVSDAYAYVEAIEGETGLIWRFIESTGGPSLAQNPLGRLDRSLTSQWRAGPDLYALYRASREGNWSAIDLEVYCRVVQSLQNWQKLRSTTWEIPRERAAHSQGAQFTVGLSGEASFDAEREDPFDEGNKTDTEYHQRVRRDHR
jgi:hypothetical protein